MKLLKIVKHLFHPQRSNNHRPKFLHPKPLTFLSIIAIGFFQLVGLVTTVHPVGGSILGYASNITVVQVVESTNKLRLSAGLGTLSYSTELAQAAIAKAQNMFSEGYWAHTSPKGTEPWDFIKQTGYVYTVAGENLARDFDTTAPMMDAWMNSPTHRANILNPRYQDIGIAVVDGLLNGVETTLVVQMFGTPDTQLVAKEQSISVPAVITENFDSDTKQQNGDMLTEGKYTPQDEPTLSPEVTGSSDQAFAQNGNQGTNNVLSEARVPQGQLSRGILYSPQHVLKAFFLSIIFVLLSVLIYDAIVAGHKNSVRFVGKNLAHIILFTAILYLVIAMKGGVVGP